MRRIPWLAEDLFDCHEKLHSMELVCLLVNKHLVSSAVTLGVVSSVSVWNIILTYAHFHCFKTRAAGTTGKQNAKTMPVDKTQHKRQTTQQRHPFPNRKHTSATAIVVTVAIVGCHAALDVADALRSDPVGEPRARAAEQQQSSDIRWCWHGERLGHTDRDPVPASWSPCVPVRGQMNCRRNCIGLFQIWASLCPKLVDFFFTFFNWTVINAEVFCSHSCCTSEMIWIQVIMPSCCLAE
jgi:hypothetical protein